MANRKKVYLGIGGLIAGYLVVALAIILIIIGRALTDNNISNSLPYIDNSFDWLVITVVAICGLLLYTATKTFYHYLHPEIKKHVSFIVCPQCKNKFYPETKICPRCGCDIDNFSANDITALNVKLNFDDKN